MTTYGGVEIQLSAFTSALDGGKWSTSRTIRFTPGGKVPRYPVERRLSGPQSRSGRGGEDRKVPALELRWSSPQPNQDLVFIYNMAVMRTSEAG
jgi:hypothetical protein